MTPRADGPVLLTERLALWRPVAGDLDELVALVTPEPVHRHLSPDVATRASQFERLLRFAGSWALYGYGMFCVRLRTGGPIIANCGVFHTLRGIGHGLDDVAEAGWVLAQPHWGTGIAAEASRAALAWFDGRHAGPVRCMIVAENAPSIRLALALGFVEYDRFVDQDDVRMVLYERTTLSE